MKSLHSQSQYAGESVIGKGLLGVCSGGYRGSVSGLGLEGCWGIIGVIGMLIDWEIYFSMLGHGMDCNSTCKLYTSCHDGYDWGSVDAGRISCMLC